MELQDQIGQVAVEKVVSTNIREYKFFDALPRIIREEIAKAPYEFSVEQIYEDYKRWQQQNWLYTPSDWEYLEIMRSNFTATMRELTPRGLYFRDYNLKRNENVPRQKVSAVYARRRTGTNIQRLRIF